MPDLQLHLVHCQSAQNGVYCLGTQGIEDLSDADSKLLLADIQKLTDLDIQYKSPLKWLIKGGAAGLKTTKLKKVTNQEMRDYMPTGSKSKEWKRWMTEVQMLLHAHLVNETRLDKGLASVDAIWIDVRRLLF